MSILYFQNFCALYNFQMLTIVIGAPTPLNQSFHIKMYKRYCSFHSFIEQLEGLLSKLMFLERKEILVRIGVWHDRYLTLTVEIITNENCERAFHE